MRVSEKTYDAKPIEAAGIKVYVSREGWTLRDEDSLKTFGKIPKFIHFTWQQRTSLSRIWSILMEAHPIHIFETNGWISLKKINWVALLFTASMVLAGMLKAEPSSIGFLGSVSLSRSPVLVAMALREAGMSRQESIDYVRSRRRGSFNVRQLEFLQNYPSAHRLAAKHAACLIM